MTTDALGNPDAVKVPLDPGANTELEGFGQRILERSRTVSGAFQGALGKARGHALRLSCILEHVWWAAQFARPPAPAAISANAMECAVGLMESYFLPMDERVFGDAIKAAAEKAEHRLAMHLKAERIDRFNARELRHAMGGSLRTAEEMDAAGGGRSYSRKTGAKIGDENLRKPEISREIRRAMEERAARTGITQDRVLREVSSLAFLDIAGAFAADGTLLPLN
ncbi:terminase small subunit [Xanthobacter flavus]|uniref:terminase small subunit n=1 Tax=Xanthobacter flavus TaxID=281 RepID=UPI0037288191